MPVRADGRPRTASRTSRVSSSRSAPKASSRWLVSPEWNWRRTDNGAGIDLHPVEAGVDGRPGRGGEPVDQRVDLGPPMAMGISRLTTSATGGRSPQHGLRVGARPLAAGVAQSGQDDGAVGTAGVRHRRHPVSQAAASGARS